MSKWILATVLLSKQWYETPAKRDKTQEISVGDEKVLEDTRFQEIRKLYGVKDDFLEGDNVNLEEAERDSGGQHAIITRTKDAKYIVKVMSDVDWTSLHEQLAAYTDHLKQYPQSTLPRFFTAFKRKTDTRRWAAMFNWMSGDRVAEKTSTKIYDLKGTSCSVTAGDRLVRMNFDDEKTPTMKDLNFVQNAMFLHTSPEARQGILDQLTLDTEFLKSKGLMDYSLILRVQVVGQCDRDALEKVCGGLRSDGSKLYQTFFQEQKGYHVTMDDKSKLMYTYEFGLIDVLQPYNVKKSFANFIKAIKCGSAEERDTVDEKAYQKRFVNYFSNRIVGDVRLLKSSDCDAVNNSASATSSCKHLTLRGKGRIAVERERLMAWFGYAWGLELFLITIGLCLTTVVFFLMKLLRLRKQLANAEDFSEQRSFGMELVASNHPPQMVTPPSQPAFLPQDQTVKTTGTQASSAAVSAPVSSNIGRMPPGSSSAYRSYC